MGAPEVRSFVYRVVDIFPGPLKTAARWVADRVWGIWDEIFTVLSLFRPVWLFFQGRIQSFISSVLWLAEETGRTLRWLVVEALPRWGKWALNTAVDYARRNLNTLRDWVDRTITWWRTHLTFLINDIVAFAHNVQAWATARFHEIWDVINVVRKKVIDLLFIPDRMVDWIFSSLWRKLWRYANDHAEAIGGLMWARRDKIIAQTLSRLESFLVRLL